MSADNRNPRLDIHIDRLVLRGIDPLDKLALASALKAELASVLGAPELRASLAQSSVNDRTIPVLRLGRMPLGSGQVGARSLGTGIARAIGKGIKP
jgi:hypothetical protein